MAALETGVVLESNEMRLSVRLTSNTVIEAEPRHGLKYMDFVYVAYDFTNNTVKKVLLPSEIGHSDSPAELTEEIQEIGNETEANRFLEELDSLF